MVRSGCRENASPQPSSRRSAEALAHHLDGRQRLRVVHAGRAEHADRCRAARRRPRPVPRRPSTPASGSTPCSAPMATDRPRSRTSLTRVTTTNCCSSACSTVATMSTASNASAIDDAPPTNTWSSAAAGAHGACSAAAQMRSTTASPRRARRRRHAAERRDRRARPTRCDARRRQADIGRRPSASSIVVSLSTDAVGEHDHDGRQRRRTADELDRADRDRLGRRPDDDGGVVGQRRPAGRRAGGAVSSSRRGRWRRTRRPAWVDAGRADPARSGGRRRSGSPCRSGSARPTCAAGRGSPPARARAISLRTVADDTLIAGASAMWFEPTGCAVVMYSWTTALRMAVLRSSSMALFRVAPSRRAAPWWAGGPRSAARGR